MQSTVMFGVVGGKGVTCSRDMIILDGGGGGVIGSPEFCH